MNAENLLVHQHDRERAVALGPGVVGRHRAIAHGHADLAGVATAALTEYVNDVRGGRFPEEQHCYHMLEGEHERFLGYAGEDA